MPKLIALQSFSGPDGTHRKGEEFTASIERVGFLVEGNYAELIDQIKEVEPTDAPPAKPKPRKK